MKTSKSSVLSALSVLRVFLAIACIFYAGELLIMLFLDTVRPLSRLGLALFDATMLIILTFPVLYLAVFRPLMNRISEHRQAEQATLAQFQLAEAVFNHSVSGIAVLDPRFNFVRVNPAYAQGSRRDVGEFPGHNHFDMYPSDAKTIFEEVVRSKRSFKTFARAFEFADQPERGVTYWDWTLVPILNSQGEVEYLFFSLYEVTERIRAEESFRESEKELRAIFDGALDGIVVADVEARKILAANPAICNMFGYTRGEMLGLEVKDIHPEQAMPRVADHFNRMLRGDLRLATEIPVIRKDRSAFYVDIKAAPIRIGGKDAALGIFRDVTERIDSEQKLVEAEAQFRGLVEQSIAGIYILQDGKYAYVNPRFAEIRGFDSAEELIGRDHTTLIAEQDRGTVAENVRRLSAGEVQRVNFNFAALRKDGSTVDVGVHSTRATHHGRPAIIGLLQDISQKKHAEDEIKRYIAQLESAFMSTVEVATTLGEMRDPYTAGHQRRVAEIAVAIGAEIGFDERRQEGLRVAGYLHDIGKIVIPAEILSRPGRLSPVEFQLVRAHAQAGYDALKSVSFPWPVAKVAQQHHERMDGSGYPQGLKGDEIMLEARVMAVADVVEAMASHRPYRPGLGINETLAEIERGRGSAYDAEVADACVRLFRDKGYQLPT